jgi:hypothetical protein
MDAETRARNRAEVVTEVSKWTVGAGILMVALAPLALPIIILTIVAILPLALPLLAIGLLVAIVALPAMLIRKLGRSVSRRRRVAEPVRRPATGH